MSEITEQMNTNDIPRNKDNCPHEEQAKIHWLARTCYKCVYGKGTACSYPIKKTARILGRK